MDDGTTALVLEDGNKSSDMVSNKPQELPQNIAKENKLKYWEEQAKYWEAKYKDLKKGYLNQSHHFSEVNIKYNGLLKMKSNTPQPDDKIDNAVNTCTDDLFTLNELKVLKNMSLDKKKDSTFIHQCLEYAYKNDMSILSSRTLKGKAESVKFSEGQETHIPKKYPLSPEKVDRIKALFIERIVKCNIDSASFEARIKDSNINKLFASSIRNIANKNN